MGTRGKLTTPCGYRKTSTRKNEHSKRRIVYEPDEVVRPLHGTIRIQIINEFPKIRMLNSIKCAKQHLGRRFLLKIDLEDAFGSVDHEDVRRVLGLNFGQLKEFFFHKEGGLIQGALVSPWIFHLYCLKLIDYALYYYCRKNKFVITRYCDDILISSHARITKAQRKGIYKIIRDAGLRINEKKTRVIDYKFQSLTFCGIRFSHGKILPTKEFVHKLLDIYAGEEPPSLKGLMRIQGLLSWQNDIVALKKWGDIL